MNYYRLLPLAGVIILAVVITRSRAEKDGGKRPEAKLITVTLQNGGYEPNKLEIHVGDSVVWTNNSLTTHTATSDDGGKTFDTGEIKPNESSKPVKFEWEGEFNNHCKIHGKSMSGTIVVKRAEKK
jgi:plastocyanin